MNEETLYGGVGFAVAGLEVENKEYLSQEKEWVGEIWWFGILKRPQLTQNNDPSVQIIEPRSTNIR